MQFSKRQVVSERLARQTRSALGTQAMPTRIALEAPVVPGEKPLLLSMVMGVDNAPRPMSRAEVEALGDAFTKRLLLRGATPLTIRELATAIDTLPVELALPNRELFAVAEGAHFKPSHPGIATNTRLVYAWRATSTGAIDLLLSNEPAPDESDALMQLIAWSDVDGAFHFFERDRGGAGWAWCGNSFHALRSPSRGRGPFDSHINGSLVMKELKFPWVHWHSSELGIPRDLLFPQPQLNSDPLFANVSGADRLESIVRAGIHRWTRQRIRRDSADGILDDVAWYARQLLWTTSINLTSASRLFEILADSEILDLPASFFYDRDGIASVIEAGTGTNTINLPGAIQVSGTNYKAAVTALGVHVDDGSTVIQADTAFCFTVPERAFEDTAVISGLMARDLLSPRLALCCLMVDYPNPVFSPRRAALLGYFPDKIPLGPNSGPLDAAVEAAIRASQASSIPSSPEAEFLTWWDGGSPFALASQTLQNYMHAVQQRAAALGAVIEILKLADSRREAFRGRTLNEFRHTTARNGVLVSLLAMDASGNIHQKTTSTGEGQL